ncbi:MAG: TetR/AcrR family transcriptional regulator [Brevibacterium sp.]|uniref:TetR/AcrR family transcriptional regulator n=1 Tax=Brevibacterium sp. TaxID=1701 RepID=UPI0026486B14|nr:TetR/AcrR family transcriptional regulator [Brevibacterium sp.]MDN5807835.1 TetR/AcrR family transcriptional regulator [Brevibacterium sp.]MDN5877351.1 TetR/AcrR family transcriptional regulator [Brevibacterium sp.]MDN5909501.1 TetR/AcrR family transcriptional regulator [Brevibacterium sp.]MDN6133948.1 TetR/AcrR family transcriptional regulator [Brevibacterium sp.]MDN6158486.1 TetR/AcrR family transcriptional regulator [Brevibacterium sp.]
MAASRDQIVSGAERVFDHRGFAASGMDDLTAAAGVSTRTLYKHLGSKIGLVVAVLEARNSRFFAHCHAASVDELFAYLEEWVMAEGSRGCLFLRAHGEAGETTPEIAEAVAAYRAQLRSMIARIVRADLGDDVTVGEDDTTVTQILVLFEGATSTASYLGTAAVTSAREAAATVMNVRRRR